ncbi:MAG: TIGR00341 family protein [Bacteroidales bacterium]
MIKKWSIGAKTFLKGVLNLNTERESYDVTVATIKDGIEFKGANVWILIFAVFMASLGLDVNSTAVIIGAMLISPLMGPIMGVGLGLGIDDFELIKKSVKNLAIATLFSVLTSTLYFFISPLNDVRSELLARTSPTIYDVLIALFGGAAGIVATATKQKGNVLPGVAIATALMPPLCTAGFGLANGNMHYFFGAFFLFIINSVFIAFATTTGVRLMKFPKKQFLDKNRQTVVERIVYVILLVTVIPSVILTYKMIKDTYFTTTAYNFVNEEFNTKNNQVLNKSVNYSDGVRTINVSIIGKEIIQDSINAIESRMPRPIAGARLVISQGFGQGDFDMEDITNMTLQQIYKDNIRKIEQQDHVIDSLQTKISYFIGYDTLAKAIAPEAKILFPQISDIALTRAVFSNVIGEKLDTATIAIVKYNTVMSHNTAKTFKAWLEARSGVKDLRILKE